MLLQLESKNVFQDSKTLVRKLFIHNDMERDENVNKRKEKKKNRCIFHSRDSRPTPTGGILAKEGNGKECLKTSSLNILFHFVFLFLKC